MTKKTQDSASEPITNDFDSEELLALTRLDIEAGRQEAALAKTKKLLASRNPPAESLAIAGRLYAQLGLWDRAKGLFQQYVAANPKARTELFQLGMVHFDSGKIDEAIKTWKDILKDDPTHPPSLFYSAYALIRQDKGAPARQLLDTLLKTAAPDNLYFGRGMELLRALDTGPMAGASPAVRPQTTVSEASRLTAKDAYKTEH